MTQRGIDLSRVAEACANPVGRSEYGGERKGVALADWERGEEPRWQFEREAERIEQERGASSMDQPTRMRWRFETDDAGLVWVVRDENYPGFSLALADALGSLSPAGEPPALSTYWVDRALTWLDASTEDDEPLEIGCGNETCLERHGPVVRAVALYETFETEELPAEEVFFGLLAWRRAILDRITQAGERIVTNAVGAVVGMRRHPH